MKRTAEDGTALQRHLGELVRVGIAGSTLIQVAAAWSVWGAWPRVLTIACVWLIMAATNWAITAAASRIGSERTEDLRLVPNVILTSVAGHASGWTLASLLFLPFAAVLVGGMQTSRPTMRLIFMVVSVSGYALLDHAVPAQVACLAGLSLFWHVAGLAHTRVARAMVREREENLARLAQAHATVQLAQQRAYASEKLAGIGKLAAGVAHEINNPMCFVTANVRGLIEDLDTARDLPPEMVEYRDDILPATLDGIERVNAIVADMRRFARGEPEAPVPFDLTTEVEAAVRISRSQLMANQTLRVETMARPRVQGMPQQIGQVALNLLVNAMQASSDTGDIVVAVGSSGDEGVFSVRDYGSGMPADVLSQLFLPFFTTKSAGSGIGLGLAVAHGIVTAHGGRITVSSEVGRGTCFQVFLPGAPDSP